VDRSVRKALTEELAIPVEVAGRAIGLGRHAAYVGVKAGDIPSIKVGRRILVPTAPLRRMLGIDRDAE
jgi:hypothetical protein